MYLKDLVYSTIKIISDTGEGTGFIIDFSLNPNCKSLVIITNKHVIDKSQDIMFMLTIQKTNNSLDYERFEIKNVLSKCILSDRYDLCAISIDEVYKESQLKNEKIVIPCITINDICSEEDLFEYGPITDVFVIGYPDAFVDLANNLPMARKGITSTPLYSNYDNRDVFVVDAGIIKGNSGSPVYSKNDDGVCRLVGVVYEEKRNRVEAGYVEDGERKEINCYIQTGMGLAIKSYEIFKLWQKRKEHTNE